MKLKEIANAKGFTFAELSRQTGISVRHISRIANGHQDCTTAYAKRLADALGVTIDDLVGDAVGEKVVVDPASG